MNVPPGYLGAEGRITAGPAPELMATGYHLELGDAPLLHRGLTLADLAHVLELDDLGIIPAGSSHRLLGVLLTMLATDVESFPYDPLYGDAYNSRERHLESLLGDEAGWLPTGRTRREAGRIAFRLAMIDKLARLGVAVSELTVTLAARADEFATTLFNDTTYLQPAQPSSFGHYLLTFAEEALRDGRRTGGALEWFDCSPAGVGGVAGTRIPLDRERLSTRLGFRGVGAHARDVMWSVDGCVDATSAAAQAAITASRLAEDLEILASPQFGVIDLDASVCRASVLLPQKKNPYALAVIRAGANLLTGRTTGVLSTRRTPSARTDNWLHMYGEVSSSVDTATGLVRLLREVVSTMSVDTERLGREAGTTFTMATDIAEACVLLLGVDYRTAYRAVATVAAAAGTEGRRGFERSDLAAIADKLGRPDHADALWDTTQVRDVLQSRPATTGSGHPASVRRRAEALRRDAEVVARACEERVTTLDAAHDGLVEEATFRYVGGLVGREPHRMSEQARAAAGSTAGGVRQA